MSVIYQKKYWSENEFTTKSGNPYSGYVGILDGQGYVYSTHDKLIKKNTYITQFNSSQMFFDRILDQPLKLPFSKSQVQFHANDFLNRGTIKNILQKLQNNNDYIYKCSTISDTLIPVVDDCSILSTVNNSYYVFVDEFGNEYTSVPNDSGIINAIENAYVVNPNFDEKYEKSNENAYSLRANDKPKTSYSSKLYKIPKVEYKISLDYGKLKSYSLLEQKNTKTALDPTFYQQVLEDGTVIKPKFNFDEIEASDIIITDVGMQKIKVTQQGVEELYGDQEGQNIRLVKRIKLLMFLAFKDKIVIIRYVYYPNDFYVNKFLGKTLDFTNDSNDIITIDCVDPSNKNSLKFLHLKDLRVRGNYLYAVDTKLNMVMRYDIEFIRTQQGLISWDKQAIRLLDLLQGKGQSRDAIYFNTPCSICADDDNIYVADKKNNCIKKYSNTFDYIRTIRNGVFGNQQIQSISINPYAFKLNDEVTLSPNSLWVFSSTDASLYVSVVSDDVVVYSHRIQRIDLLDDKYTWKEQFKSVKFSFCDSNYYYLSTTKRVYKLHLSNPSYPFASLSYFKQRALITSMIWGMLPYPWHILPCGEDDSGVDVTWGYRPPSSSAQVLDNSAFCLCGVDDYTTIDKSGDKAQFNGDIIFHIGTLYNQTKVDMYCKRHNCSFEQIPQNELAKMIKTSGVFLYNQTSSFITSMTQLNFPCYLLEDIEDIDPSEYVNPLTFNKLVYKVVYNLVNLKNHIIGRFWGAYNLDNIMVFDQLEYDNFFQQLRLEKENDLYAHDNEALSIMINRVFEKIYDVQETILSHMEAKYRSQGAFTNNSFRII